MTPLLALSLILLLAAVWCLWIQHCRLKRSEQALRDTKHRLANRAAELDRLVQERTARLRETVQELEAFSYSVSHDLRAPLRHIIGFVQLLQQQSTSSPDPEALRLTDMIAESARQMRKLIDDLLAFARMGRAEIRTASIEMEPLIREVIDNLALECHTREISWKIAPLPSACADRALLRQVWFNLLSNALKYTSPRPRAKIEIGHLPGSNGEHVYFVRDNGVGFDMAHVQKLFGVFQRLHRAQEFEGSGIGLANVRRIITRHGGRTWAEGKLDVGATFYFSLPISNSSVQPHVPMQKAA